MAREVVISVRGLEADTLQALMDQARCQGISLNQLFLQRLSGDTNASRQSPADLAPLGWSLV